MMKNKHIKGLLIASGFAVIGLVGAIGGTYALFNRSLSVVTHVKVGNLNFSFRRTNLKQKVLNDSGYLEEKVDNSVLDLTENGAEAFNLDSIVPGSEVESTFTLSNTGGTAFETAFSLLNIAVKDGEETVSNVSWLDNVSVKCLKEGTEEASFTLGDLRSVDLGDLAKGAEMTFSLKLSFDANAIGNEMQSKDISFAMRLNCTQVVE